MNILIFKKLKKKFHSTFLKKFIIILFLIYTFHIKLKNCFYINNNPPNFKYLETYKDNINNIPKCNLCFNCPVCIHENEQSENIIPLIAIPSKRKYFYDKNNKKNYDNITYKLEKKNAPERKYSHDFKESFFLENKSEIRKKRNYQFLESYQLSNYDDNDDDDDDDDDDNDDDNDDYNENKRYHKNGYDNKEDIEDNSIYKKNDQRKHGEYNKSSSLNNNVTLPLQQLQDSQFVSSIKIGNPPQIIRPIFDTGSTNIWIVSTKCSDDTCLKVNRYDYKASKSFKYYMPYTDLDIMFGTGTIQGVIGIETFTIGPFKVENQSFGLVKREKGKNKDSNVFEKIKFEGIIGLAFPSLLSTGKVSFYENLLSLYKFKHKEFSIYIGKDNKYSALIFGGVDKRFFEGSIFMFPVVRNYYWEIAFDGLYIDHQKFCCDPTSIVYDLKKRKKKNIFLRKFFKKISHYNYDNILGYDEKEKLKQNKNYLIFDSGTSFNSVPKSEIKYFFEVVPPKKCNDDNVDEVISSYPNLTYVINRMPFVLTPTQYLIRNQNICKPAFMEIEVSSEHGHAYIVGNATFMKNYYVVYRVGNEKQTSYVGIAKSVHTEENEQYLKSINEKNNQI